jgi:hypothetical protein
MTKLPIRLVGLTGLAGAGKTTAAEVFTDWLPFTRLSFATPIKEMLRVIIPDVSDKEARPPVLGGYTVRHALQTLGTEWGRMQIDHDLWVRAAMEKAREALGQTPCARVVFDDVRFENEAQAILDAGGVIVKIERPGVQGMSHVSEKGLPDSMVTAVLQNNASVEELRLSVFKLAFQLAA